MRYATLAVLVLLLVSAVSALPTTGAATLVGNNNVTMQGTGITGSYGWFNFGMASGQTWASTDNVTQDGAGGINYTLSGTPLFNSTTYYYRACDPTGCGAQVSFITGVVTPVPSTTNGQWARQIITSHFDPVIALWAALQPFIALTTATVFWGILFGLIFVGIWLRTRGTLVASQLWMVTASLACSSAAGLYLGMPPEFIAVAQGLLYISLAGTIVAFTFR